MVDFFQPTGKKVLLFSGGMDSVCYAWILRPDVLVTIGSRSEYEEQERIAMKGVVEQFGVHGYRPEHIMLDDVVDLSRFHVGPFIVANRNAYFVLIASWYGETVYLAGVSGDSPKDKDPEFFRIISLLLSHMWEPASWTAGRNFHVTAPFRDTTKTELISQYLRLGGPTTALWASYSCYSGRPTPCGVCKNCTRKWVAYANNGLHWRPGLSEKPPWEAEWVWNDWKKLLEGKYHGKEDKEILRAFDSWIWTNSTSLLKPIWLEMTTEARLKYPDLRTQFWL